MFQYYTSSITESFACKIKKKQLDKNERVLVVLPYLKGYIKGVKCTKQGHKIGMLEALIRGSDEEWTLDPNFDCSV